MSISEPAKIPRPFAETGLKNPIPPAANNTTGKAGFDKGFPERTMLPKASGGIPPSGMDFNGILYDVTSAIRYMQAGGRPTYDAAFASAIGGYPSGAVLIGDDGASVFKNAVDGNATDPNSGGSGWTRPDLQVMELYRRSYAEAGYNVVGTFQAGFTYVNANDVGIDETTGKGFTGPAGTVAADTDPTSGGFVDVSSLIYGVSSVSCLALGMFYPGSSMLISDRGYARFNVVTGGTPNGMDILDAGNGNSAVLVLDRPTPIHFGAKGNKIDDDSDSLERWLNCSYGALYGLGKDYKVTRKLDATQSKFKRLVGDGMTFWSEFGALSAETVILDLKERPTGQPYLEKVHFDCLDPDSAESETLNTGETFNWVAKSWLVCLYASEGVTLESCRFYRHKLPYRINGIPGDTFKNGSKTRIFDCWHIECRASGGTTGSGVVTLCDSVEVHSNFYWLGGEATFPSNRRLSISDNIAFIPGTPTIDVGGSLGALTDTVKITNNISFGRDPIVCELGTKITLISSNICVVTSNNPNGVGIGVTSDFAGGQAIDTLKIEGNQISHYNDLGTTAQYSHGIKVSANANTIARVDVTDNTAYGPRICVQVDSNATDCDVSNNNGYQCYRGAVLNCSGTANRNKFTSLGGAPQVGGYGLGVFGGGNMKLKDNDTAKFEKDYRFEGALDRYQLLTPIHDHANIVDVIHLANHTGFIYFEGVRAGGADPFLANYKRGSTKTNPTPSVGGYMGFVAVGDGGPMKGYGAIQA